VGPPRRHNSLRLAGYDYSQVGAYHVTIGTQEQRQLLGKPKGLGIELTTIGREVERCWKEIPQHYYGVLVDAYAVMPNHFHGLVILVDPRAGDQNLTPRTLDLPAVIQRFKSLTTRIYRGLIGNLGSTIVERLWQRGYWDEIINSEAQFEKVQKYITNNALADYLKREGLL
jgi:REP element-mobilizing transposase RayT